MTYQPLLSIVIPTKNRYEYLEILIKALLESQSQEFELIIQDNSDNNNDFERYLETINDSRLKYNYLQSYLSVIENCDLAVGTSTGKYVIMLGDDDGILIEKSIELVKYLSKNNADAAIVNWIDYAWPDTIHAVWGDGLSGKIIVPRFTYSYKWLNSQQELKQVLHKGAAFGLGRLARIYHGIVKKEKLDAIKAETGTYFPGPSPDMANAVALTKYIETYIYADFPTIISGHSKKSTGGQGGEKKHHGSIAAQAHLPKDTVSKWSPKIPFFWSGPTIYSESARRSILATNRESFLKINYAYLYACCFVFERAYTSEIIKAINLESNPYKRIVTFIKIIYFCIIIFISRIFNFATNLIQLKFKSDEHLKAVSISEAIKIMNTTLNK